MKAKKTLWPGDPGTKKLMTEYGDELFCIRYRYDRVRQKSYKTVELIIESHDWIPNTHHRSPNRIVSLKIDYEEYALRTLIKQNGGKWNPKNQTWQMPYKTVKELKLQDRMQ